MVYMSTFLPIIFVFIGLVSVPKTIVVIGSPDRLSTLYNTIFNVNDFEHISCNHLLSPCVYAKWRRACFGVVICPNR